MRLPGRMAAAMDVLSDMERTHRPAGLALKDWGTSHRFAGAGDRAAIGNLVYDALRRRASHAWAMQADTPRALVLSVAVHDWREDARKLQVDFAVDRFGPGAITDAEMAHLLAGNPLRDAPDHIRANIPEWMTPQLAEAFGQDWLAEAQAFTGRPPLDLRVNRLKAEPEKLLKALQRFEPVSLDLLPGAIRIPAGARDDRTANVQADETWRKGWVEIQDYGSQIVAALAAVQPGQQVLDLCAGAGGKTLALSAHMQNKGQIFAHDADRTRLAPIYERLKRNGARNVQVRAPDDGSLDDLAGRMDCVLVDAPCTGTGTWRRRPDTKWRLSEAQLAQRQAEQDAVLAQAARYVKPGGHIAYITCSVLPAENTGRIEHFLARNPDFTTVDPDTVWRGAFGGEARHAYMPQANGLLLTPRVTGSDGFFFSMLRKSA